jgi:hypothetical protein
VCAAETLLACIARADAQLCQRVGIADPRTAVGQPPALVEYFIERSSIIRREDIPEDLGDVDWYKPGYALVEIQRRSCQPGKPNCAEESWTDLQVYARPRGNLWDIVTWRSEAGDESAPDLPDAFNTPRPRR